MLVLYSAVSGVGKLKVTLRVCDSSVFFFCFGKIFIKIDRGKGRVAGLCGLGLKKGCL